MATLSHGDAKRILAAKLYHYAAGDAKEKKSFAAKAREGKQ
jgi:hypothetical protein